MAGKDAEITVGANASAAEKAAAALKLSWVSAAHAIQGAFGDTARTMVSNMSEIALAQGKVNFSAQHNQVREFEASTARLAISMGRDLEAVRGNLERTGVAIGKRPQEVAQWASEVGKLTFNFAGAAEGMKGMANLAADTGRNVDDYRGLAVELGTVGKVTGDTTNAVGVLRAQADSLGTVGGVAAFAGQVENLSETISHFAITSQADFLKVTGAAAVLTRGLSDAAAKRVQQSAFGSIAADPMGWSRYLGRDITDENGQVANPTKVLEQITEKIKHTYGKDARRMLMLQFGAETGAALFKSDFSKAATAVGLAPSTAPEQKQAAYMATDAGQREQADAQLAVSSRNLMGSATKLGAAADALQKFAASNPLTSTFGTMFASTALSNFMTRGGNALATMAGGSGEGGAFGGMTRLLGGAAPVLAGLAATAAAAGASYLAYRQISSTGRELYGDKGASGFLDDLKFKVSGQSAAAGSNRNRGAYEEQQRRNLELAHARQASVKPPGGSEPMRVELDYSKVAAAMKENVVVEIHPATTTPVSATVRGGKSAAAGSQANG